MAESKGALAFVGTYTVAEPFLDAANGEGIYVYRLDLRSGSLEYLSHVRGLVNPSFLTLNPSGTRLFAVAEIFEWKEGLLFSYAVDSESGALRYLNMQPTLGSLPCYVTLDQHGRYAMVANYWSGNAAVFPVSQDGRVQPASDVVQHSGSGPHPQRQEGPHAHCAVVDPTNRFLFVTDLGLDRIYSYRLVPDQGKLLPNNPPWLALEPGSGPRHLVFDSTARYAYLITELHSSVEVLAYDPDRGSLHRLQVVPTLPKGFEGESSGADIHIHPSGKFLYGSNRGHDSIVVYSIDEASGLLSYVGHHATLGRTPRGFAIDPGGQFLLAANQDSDTIVTFLIDQETGGLEPTNKVTEVGTPVCIKFFPEQ